MENRRDYIEILLSKYRNFTKHELTSMFGFHFSNFSEYRFKEKNKNYCFSPNSATPNFFKPLIRRNF